MKVSFVIPVHKGRNSCDSWFKQMELMEQKYINYVGPSMNPLLVDGDGLHIVPYKDRAIRPGDVVVFIPPGSETKIVHRVVSVDARGIRTRGDNATTVDPWILSPGSTSRDGSSTSRGKTEGEAIVGGFRGAWWHTHSDADAFSTPSCPSCSALFTTDYPDQPP